MFITKYKTPFGETTLASDGENLTGLWFDGQKYFASTISEETEIKNDLKIFQQTKDWLERYFANEKPLISELSLNPQGSDFRKAVWQILCEIPYGKVVTYGEIAVRIAKDFNKPNMSAQAIGGAVGHNPISIIIPCHRVVGTNGSLTGYAGGIDKKIQLLNLEGVDVSKFKEPVK